MLLKWLYLTLYTSLHSVTAYISQIMSTFPSLYLQFLYSFSSTLLLMHYMNLSNLLVRCQECPVPPIDISRANDVWYMSQAMKKSQENKNKVTIPKFQIQTFLNSQQRSHLQSCLFQPFQKLLMQQNVTVLMIENKKEYSPVFLKISFKNFLHQKLLEYLLKNAKPGPQNA